MEQNKMEALPEGWKWMRLEEIAKVFTGSPAPQNAKSFENGSEPFVRVSDLGAYGKTANLLQTRDKLNPTCLDSGFVIARKGTVLFPKSGASILTNNRGMLGMDAFIVSHLGAIYSHNQETNKYLYHFLCAFDLSALCENEAYPSLKISKVCKIRIPTPPRPEQERIVAKLDGIFEHIDASIKLLEQNIADADAMAKSINDEMFCSAEFESESLDSVVSIISGISLPSIFNKNWSNNGLIPFYKVAQMNNDPRRMKGALLLFNEETSKREKIKVFPRGTVVFPKRGGAIFTNKKRILTEDGSYDSNIMGLKANPEVLSDEYLLYFLNSVDFGAIVDDAGIPQINNKHIRGIKIPLPPLPEQERIVAKLDAFFAEQKAAKAKYESQITELKALKSSILSSAFRGEI